MRLPLGKQATQTLLRAAAGHARNQGKSGTRAGLEHSTAPPTLTQNLILTWSPFANSNSRISKNLYWGTMLELALAALAKAKREPKMLAHSHAL